MAGTTLRFVPLRSALFRSVPFRSVPFRSPPAPPICARPSPSGRGRCSLRGGGRWGDAPLHSAPLHSAPLRSTPLHFTPLAPANPPPPAGGYRCKTPTPPNPAGGYRCKHRCRPAPAEGYRCKHQKTPRGASPWDVYRCEHPWWQKKMKRPRAVEIRALDTIPRKCRKKICGHVGKKA